MTLGGHRIDETLAMLPDDLTARRVVVAGLFSAKRNDIDCVIASVREEIVARGATVTARLDASPGLAQHVGLGTISAWTRTPSQGNGDDGFANQERVQQVVDRREA